MSENTHKILKILSDIPKRMDIVNEKFDEADIETALQEGGIPPGIDSKFQYSLTKSYLLTYIEKNGIRLIPLDCPKCSKFGKRLVNLPNEAISKLQRKNKRMNCYMTYRCKYCTQGVAIFTLSGNRDIFIIRAIPNMYLHNDKETFVYC